MGVISLLASRNYIVLNKELARQIGLEESILLGELASEYEYWLNREELEDGYFYSTVDNIQENTTLSEYKQRAGLNKLKDFNIVDIKIKGMPAKRYIKINEEEVIKLFSTKMFKNLRPSSEKIKELAVKKLKGNNNKLNNNNNNNNIICIIEYLNQKAKTNYKSTTNKTKTLINARFKEGFTKDDFILVIDNKVNEWLGTDMEKYLRPETLFGNKFESYLNQKTNRPKWFKKEIEKDDLEDTSELEEMFKEFR